MAKPLWRRVFDTAERGVAPHLEGAVQSEHFADAVVLVQRSTTGVRRRVEGMSRSAWHLLNLPAGSDVRRLRRQVSSLDREVRLLREALETKLTSEREEPSGGRRGGAAGAGGRGGQAAARRGAQRAPGAQRHQNGDGNG